MEDRVLMQAAGDAVAAGAITQSQHDELMAAAAVLGAIDWKSILNVLPLFGTLFPQIAPFIAIVNAVLPFLQKILNLDLVPNINGGDLPVPVP